MVRRTVRLALLGWVLAEALLPHVAHAQEAARWTHAVVLHPPDLNVFWPLDREGRHNNPRSVTVAYGATNADGLTLQFFGGVADGPEPLRPLAGRYRGLDIGAGLLHGDYRGGRGAYWRGWGLRAAFAQVGFAFDGYALAAGGGYYVAAGEGRGALRQWSLEPQWVHRWYLPGTPLLLEAALGLEFGGRGMFSRQVLFPNHVDESPLLLEPNRYHAFAGPRLRFGLGWGR